MQFLSEYLLSAISGYPEPIQWTVCAVAFVLITGTFRFIIGCFTKKR